MTHNQVLLIGALCLVPLAAEASPKQSKEERRAARRKAAERQARLKQVQFCIDSLGKPDQQTRFELIWNLRVLAPDSVAPLVRLVEARNSKAITIEAAVEALSEINDPKARQALEGVAVDPEVALATRLKALIGIARLLDAPSRTFLQSFAQGKLPQTKQVKQSKKRRPRRTRRGQPAVDPLLRRAALVALGMVEDPGAKPAIEAALALKRDPETRRVAYRTIGYLKDQRLIPLCVEGLKDSNSLVRGQAANAMGKTGDVKTADAIERNVARMPNSGERFLLLDALAWLGRQGAIKELDLLAQARGSTLQSLAATVLVEIKATSALPGMRKVLDEQLRKGNHQAGIGQILAFGLGDLGDQKAIPVLIRALNKGTPATQREAATALGRLRAKEAVPDLLKVVQKGRLYSRVGALIALGRIGDRRAAARLTKSLTDRDAPVRWAAAVALERLAEPKTLRHVQRLTRDQHPFVAAQARQTVAALQGKSVARARPVAERDVKLSRLRSLEREYVIRHRLESFGPYFEVVAAQAATVIKARAGEAPMEMRMVYPNEAAVLSWESVISTCGGTHPPIEYRWPVEIKAGETVGLPRWETTDAFKEWQRGIDEEVAKAERDLLQQNSAELAVAERLYRLKTIRARVEAELAEGDNAASGKRRP